MDAYPIYLKVKKEDISVIKFIVESYEDLGIVRTLNPECGEIVILTTQDTKHHMREMLKNLSSDVEIQEIDPPASIANDWLLAE